MCIKKDMGKYVVSFKYWLPGMSLLEEMVEREDKEEAIQ